MNLEKRGQGNTGLIIVGVVVALIVVGVVVLFVLRPETGETQSTPNPIGVQCQNQCDSGSKIGFCDVERRARDSVVATCYQLSTNSQYSEFNVQPCATVSCASQTSSETSGTPSDDQTCAGLSGIWENPTAEGSCPAQEGKFVRKRTAEDSPPVEGQVCCYYYE